MAKITWGDNGGEMTVETRHDLTQALEEIRKGNPFAYVAIQSADGCLFLGAVLFVVGLIPLAISLVMR